MTEVLKLDMRCPLCGHGTMHFGEPATLRGEVRTDVFHCRSCDSAYEICDIEEIIADYVSAVHQAKGGD